MGKVRMGKLLSILIFLSAPSMSFANEWDFSINFSGGLRNLAFESSNNWSVVNNQLGGDIRFEAKKKSWTGALVIGTSSSTSEDKLCDAVTNLNCKLAVSEIYIGELIYFRETGFRPYIGYGLSYISVNATTTRNSTGQTASATDNSIDYYADGGVLYRFDNGFNAGTDIRAILGSRSFSSFYQLWLLLGYNW